eukprot:gene19866-26560_t
MTLSARAVSSTPGEAGAYRRINLDPVYPIQYGADQEESARSRSGKGAKFSHGSSFEGFGQSTVDEPQRSQKRVHTQEGSRSGKRRHDVCPLAVLVGIDGSPDPGLRPATNFLAVVGPDMLHLLDTQLARLRRSMELINCKPTIIAYGHQTLSTVAYILSPVIRPHPSNISDREEWLNSLEEKTSHTLGIRLDEVGKDVLGRWDVSAYLCGHLHDTFGHRTHRMHPKSSPTATGYLAELEMADWKHSRWFRLATTDKDAGLSFADFSFQRDLDEEGDAEEPFEVIPIDKTRIISSFIVIITSPPDARY